MGLQGAGGSSLCAHGEHDDGAWRQGVANWRVNEACSRPEAHTEALARSLSLSLALSVAAYPNINTYTYIYIYIYIYTHAYM